MARQRSDEGQASVEFVALLPLVAAIAALLWQAAVAGQAVWLAGTAARAAARAAAVGGDPADAARSVLPPSLHRGLAAEADADGVVSVRVRIPSIAGWPARVATVTTTARFRSQGA